MTAIYEFKPPHDPMTDRVTSTFIDLSQVQMLRLSVPQVRDLGEGKQPRYTVSFQFKLTLRNQTLKETFDWMAPVDSEEAVRAAIGWSDEAVLSLKDAWARYRGQFSKEQGS